MNYHDLIDKHVLQGNLNENERKPFIQTYWDVETWCQNKKVRNLPQAINAVAKVKNIKPDLCYAMYQVGKDLIDEIDRMEFHKRFIGKD